MKRLFMISCLVGLMVSTTPWLWAQEEDLSANRMWGIGARFLPSALSPIAPFAADPALGSAIVGQYWLNEMLALEAGGWVSNFKDAWSENSTTVLSGGLLVKLANHSRFDLYAAGRAVQLDTMYRGGMVCLAQTEDQAQPDSSAGTENAIPPMPPCRPWPGNESHTSTLAFEAAGGLEWSVASQVAFNFEFGMMYAQTTTMNFMPPPLPPTPEAPKPLKQAETFASSSVNWVIHTGIYLYF